jgi:solute carrier family 35 (GDP-fucose transporter), member C1
MLGIISSFFGVLNGIYLKKTLDILDANLWELNYYINLISSLVLLPVSFVFYEHVNIFEFEPLYTFQFWLLMSSSGVIGFLLGLATTFQMHHTAPLTANISGVTKSCMQTLLGVFWFSEIKTLLWWTSNALVITGATSYSIVRHNLMKK